MLRPKKFGDDISASPAMRNCHHFVDDEIMALCKAGPVPADRCRRIHKHAVQVQDYRLGWNQQSLFRQTAAFCKRRTVLVTPIPLHHVGARPIPNSRPRCPDAAVVARGLTLIGIAITSVTSASLL